MSTTRSLRDNTLIDALEAIPSTTFEDTVWRVVKEGSDVLQCSAYGGRWDDGSFDVLYTSQNADGAIAEMHFHLSRGLPVIPSRVSFHLFELLAKLHNALRLADLREIAALGIDTARYGALSYLEKKQEYPRAQELAETAHFVGFDGLIVPSARWQCLNVILFCDRVVPGDLEIARDHGTVDWATWSKQPLGL